MNLLRNIDQKECFVVFCAQHLRDLLKRAPFGEAQFFSIDCDVPYIAEVIATGVSAQYLSRDKPGYLHVEPVSLITNNFDKMDPILGRDIADGAVLNLVFFGALPNTFKHSHGTTQISSLYRKIATIYPETTLRPALQSMGEDFPVWVYLLPKFKREASLLI